MQIYQQKALYSHSETNYMQLLSGLNSPAMLHVCHGQLLI